MRTEAPSGDVRFLGFLLVLGLAACGEYHTARFWESDAHPEDVDASDMSLDTADTLDLVEEDLRCMEPGVLEISSESPLSGFVGVPYFWQITTTEGAEKTWVVVDGALPAGLSLSSWAGYVSGLPEKEGEFHFVVEATALDLQTGCEVRAQATLAIRVTRQCAKDSDCLPALQESYAGSCLDGVCRYSGDSCVSAGSSRVRMDASAQELCGSSPYVVVDHLRLLRDDQDPKDRLTHRLLLGRDEELFDLDYAMPEGWSLPIRAGDRVEVGGRALATGQRLDFWLEKDRRWVGLMTDGPSQLLTEFSVSAGDSFSFQALPASCDARSDQCGTLLPRVIRIQKNLETLDWLAPGDVLDWDNSDALQLGVGVAYGYEQLDPLQCLEVLPEWLSAWAVVRDRCPIPRLRTSSSGVESLGAAFSRPPDVYYFGWESLGTPESDIEEWHWTLEQPYEGLVGLKSKGGGEPTQAGPLSLWTTAVGRYVVGLRIKDSSGAWSCFEDRIQLDVLPSSSMELRIELVWTDKEGTFLPDTNLDLMLAFPAYWDQDWSATSPWVCNPLNPYPSEWMLGDLTHADEICECQDGLLEGGMPEVITLQRLNRTFSYPYLLAVQSPSEATQTLYATLRVYLGGEKAFERIRRPVPPGERWIPGAISSALGAFIAY